MTMYVAAAETVISFTVVMHLAV